MPSVFSKIIIGELPATKVYENDLVLAIMDISPLKKGHVIVFPKVEVDKIYDLDETYYQELMRVGKVIAKSIEKSIDCKRVSMMVLGLEVPHAHLHLIPIKEENDANFVQDKMKVSQEELYSIAETIKSNLV